MTIIEGVTRWQPDAAGRLAAAAMELYAERGFDQTTVAEIAARAGLTERTFFRHFADKREVLFAGAGELEALFAGAVAGAPADAAPIEAVAAGLDAAAAVLQGRREFARRRQRIIAGSVELTERERGKLASLSLAVAQALRERGVADRAASLTAELAIAVFRIGFERWVGEDGASDYGAIMRETLGELRTLAAGATAGASR